MGSLTYPDFKGPATKIADIDIPRIAAEIGVGEDELHPFIDVETSGSGFDDQGRPKMLFEPSKFYAHLGPGAVRDDAVAKGLAYAKWGEKPYPADSYPHLTAAMAISQTSALKSASWGMGQVMGENAEAIGYASAEDLVNAACESEANHLQMMVDFIKANHLDDDLRALADLKRAAVPADVAAIVRVYNGPGYAKNKYDVKFAAAYNKWRKIPDTPYVPDPAPAAPAVDNASATTAVQPVAAPVIVPPAPADVTFTRDQVTAFQQDLKAKGYIEVGRPDGIIGKNTLSAITAFEIAQGLPISGALTQDLWDAVKAAPMRPVSEERANATTKTLIDDGQPAIKPALALQKIAGGVLATAGLGAVTTGGEVDLDKAMTFSTKVQSILAMLGHLGPWLIAAGVGGAVLYYARDIGSRLLADYRKGTLR